MSIITSDYTLRPNDDVLEINGTLNLTLITTGIWIDKVVRVKLIAANAVGTITGPIDGQSFVTLTRQWDAVDLHWDGSSWNRLAITMSNSRMGQVDLNFGSAVGQEGNVAIATVTGTTWVQSASVIVVQSAATATANHDPEDAVIEDIEARALNIVPGVSFDIEAHAPSGAWGTYTFIYLAQLSRTATPQ